MAKKYDDERKLSTKMVKIRKKHEVTMQQKKKG